MTTIREKALRYLGDLGGSASVQQIADAVGATYKSTSRYLSELETAGQVTREAVGNMALYSLPPEAKPRVKPEVVLPRWKTPPNELWTADDGPDWGVFSWRHPADLSSKPPLAPNVCAWTARYLGTEFTRPEAFHPDLDVSRMSETQAFYELRDLSQMGLQIPLAGKITQHLGEPRPWPGWISSEVRRGLNTLREFYPECGAHWLLEPVRGRVTQLGIAPAGPPELERWALVDPVTGRYSVRWGRPVFRDSWLPWRVTNNVIGRPRAAERVAWSDVTEAWGDD